MLTNSIFKKTAIAYAILTGISTTHYVFAETTDSAISTSQKIIKVHDENSFKNALSSANAGDTIQFSQDINITQYTQTTGQNPNPLYLDKQVTIDGNGHTLSVRAAPLALKADVVLKNVSLQLKPLNKQLTIGTQAEELTSYIYANGHRLELDNVTTKAEGLHERTRPTIIMGTVDDTVNDAGHAELVVKNSKSETHFKQIIANSLNTNKSTSTKISLDKDTKLIDNTGLQIDFSTGSYKMTGKVEVVLDGTKVSSLGGNNAADNSVTLKNASLVNPKLIGLKDLTLEKSSVAVGGVNVKGKLDLKDSSTLSIDNYSTDMTIDNTPEADRKKVQAQTVNSEGGTIELRVDGSSINVSGNMEGNLTLKITPSVTLNGDIITVGGTNSATITSGNQVYKVKKNGNKWTVSKNPPAGSNYDNEEEDIDDEDEENWTVIPDPNTQPSEEKPTEQPQTKQEETSESSTGAQETATEPNSNTGEEATKPSTSEEKPSENTAGEQTGSEQPQADAPSESDNSAETAPIPQEKPSDGNAISGDQNGEQANGSNGTNGETSTPENGSETSQPSTNGEDNKSDAENEATQSGDNSTGTSENTTQPSVPDQQADEAPTGEQDNNSASTEMSPSNEGNNVTLPKNEDTSKSTPPTGDNTGSTGESTSNEASQPSGNNNSTGVGENIAQPTVPVPATDQGSGTANVGTPPSNTGNGITQPTTTNNVSNEVRLLNQNTQKATLLLDMLHNATFTSARQNANVLIERSYDRNEGSGNLWVENNIAKENNGFSDEKYKDISRHLMIGVNKCSAYLCAGVAFSANNSDLSSDNLSLQQKMYYAFGYGNYALSDNAKVNFYLGSGVGRVKDKDRNEHRSYRAKSLQSGVGIGYSFVAESYRVTPFVRADYVATHYAAYQTEAFSVDSHTAKSLVAKVGMRVDKQVNQNLNLFAKAEMGVETLRNGSASVSVSNQNQTLNLPSHSRHSASMGAGVSYSFTPNVKISATYNYERRSGYNNQSADLALQYKF